MSKIVVVILAGILLITGTGLFLYQREVQRQADERCADLHRQWDPRSLSSFNIETELRKKCGGLTAEEKSAKQIEEQARDKRIQDAECQETLLKEGPESTNAKRKCPADLSLPAKRP